MFQKTALRNLMREPHATHQIEKLGIGSTKLVSKMFTSRVVGLCQPQNDA